MRADRYRWIRVQLVLAALALPAFVASTTARASIDDPVLRTRETVLDNGLIVLTLEDHATPVVSFQMWVRVGSRDESRVTGLAHLFEHMMFKGSKNVPPEEHARFISARGGRSNAFTTHDFTVYLEDVTADSLPLVIDLGAERVANLVISDETLVSEREVVIEERRMRTDDRPGGRGIEALMALTFKAHPYRWPVIGWRSDIESTTVEICREFFEDYYVPNNMVIVIVGDFDTEEALDRIRRTYGRLESAAFIPRNPTTEPIQDGERRAIVHFDHKSPLLFAAWHAPGAGHDDAEALDIASQILSGGHSSRLYRRLVRDEEQALYAYGAFSEMVDEGMFYAVASVRSDATIERVEDLFFGEIARLREEPVTEAELVKAKTQIEVALIRGLQTNHALANRIGHEFSVYGRIRPLSEILERIQAVTIEDVQRVAATYLVDHQRSVVHVVAPPTEVAQ